ncbi:MAG: hypothetical protein GC129_03910 [Proteobacteria bacterium]|nr:hypothetical protein [Pseudomonadota bacterium]
MSLLKQEAGLTWQALKNPLAGPLLLGAALWSYVAWAGQGGPVLASLLVAFILLLQSLVDLKHGLLTHSLNALLALSGLVLAPLYLGLPLPEALLGPLVFFAVFAAMAWLAGRLAGRPALGGGDLWLVAALGCWLGAGGLPPFLLALAILGLALVAWRRAFPKKGRKAQFPFGPVLAAAGWLTLLHQTLYWKCIISLTV